MKFLILLIKRLPDNLSLRLLESYLGYCFKSDFKNEGLKNIKLIFPTSSPSDRETIFKKFKKKLARSGLDFFRNPVIDSARVRNVYKIIEQKEFLDDAKRNSNGIGSIVLCTQFDAFEYLIHLPIFQFSSIHTRARGYGLSSFDNWWKKQNEENRRKIYDGEDAYAEVVKKIVSGEDVLITCDQSINPRKPAVGDFYGLPAASSRIITSCSMRTGCEILMSSVYVTKDSKTELHIEKILNPKEVKGSDEKKVKEVSKSIHKAFDRRVKKDPLSWFWVHRLWNSKSNNKPEDVF